MSALQLISNNKNNKTPDYEQLYFSLYNQVTDVINSFIGLQQYSEEIYLSGSVAFHNREKRAKGITRNIDNLGRIVIPSEYRKSLDISDGDMIEILMVGNGLLLQKNNYGG